MSSRFIPLGVTGDPGRGGGEGERIQRAMRDKGCKPLYVVNPHTLRHFHAVRALGLGIPLNDLQAQLEHTDLKTASVYSRPTSTTGGRATMG